MEGGGQAWLLGVPCTCCCPSKDVKRGVLGTEGVQRWPTAKERSPWKMVFASIQGRKLRSQPWAGEEDPGEDMGGCAGGQALCRDRYTPPRAPPLGTKGKERAAGGPASRGDWIKGPEASAAACFPQQAARR